VSHDLHRQAPYGTVLRVETKNVVVALVCRKEIVLDLRRPDSFDVARPRQIEVSPGDKKRIRANDKRLGLTNGQVFTISGAPDGALQTNEGFCVPADCRQWRHGYVVTSHKAQGGGQRITSSLRRNGSPPKQPTWHVPEAGVPASSTLRTKRPDRKIVPGKSPRRTECALRKSRSTRLDRQPCQSMEAALIDLAQRLAAQLNQPSADRMRIAPPQKRLSQSIPVAWLTLGKRILAAERDALRKDASDWFQKHYLAMQHAPLKPNQTAPVAKLPRLAPGPDARKRRINAGLESPSLKAPGRAP
jgi:hypothetical protein